MLVTDLGHVAEQIAPTPMMAKAIAFLKQLDGRKLEDGRTEIDGARVYALGQSYQTATPETIRFEAHRKYIDLQYMVSGLECAGWAPLGLLQSATPYDESRDILLGTVAREDVTYIRLAPGQLAVFYPADAHAPKLAAGHPGEVKKIVIKVAVEQG
jgi:biofilm protein TabA